MNIIDLEYFAKTQVIIGCDEVGRGPIAGPVNACAVKINRNNSQLINLLVELKVTDSKKLTDKKRKIILEQLNIDVSNIEVNKVYKNLSLGFEFEFCLTEHSHEEIDSMNILQASLSAMKRASEYMRVDDAQVFIDGNKTFDSSMRTQAVIKGDSKFVVIGLASIIAKVFRDEKMRAFDKEYPGYNLAKHAGYPTKEHKNAVAKIGPSPIHRKTFKGVKEFL